LCTWTLVAQQFPQRELAVLHRHQDQRRFIHTPQETAYEIHGIGELRNPRVVRDYQQAAARRCGFDGVEIHGANGFDRRVFAVKTNHRQDHMEAVRKSISIFERGRQLSLGLACQSVRVRLSPTAFSTIWFADFRDNSHTSPVTRSVRSSHLHVMAVWRLDFINWVPMKWPIFGRSSCALIGTVVTRKDAEAALPVRPTDRFPEPFSAILILWKVQERWPLAELAQCRMVFPWGRLFHFESYSANVV